MIVQSKRHTYPTLLTPTTYIHNLHKIKTIKHLIVQKNPKAKRKYIQVMQIKIQNGYYKRFINILYNHTYI